MSYENTLTSASVFARYEELRPRFPSATFPSHSEECNGLLDIADQFDAFLLDSFGVLNVGDHPIRGASECLNALREQGKRLLILTNAASYTKDIALQRYNRLGFDVSSDEIVSSREVAVSRLDRIVKNGRWGAIATPEDAFEDINANVTHWNGQDVDGFLLLSSTSIDTELLTRLEEALHEHPRPLVVANPDLVAPRETGLSKEPGFYAHYLADKLGQNPNFFGKPFADAYEDARTRLDGIPAHRTAMVGDTLHTDILGGRAAGMKTVLVKNHGIFAGMECRPFVEQSGIIPDYECRSI